MSYADYQEHFDRMVQELSARYATMPTRELVRLLEKNDTILFISCGMLCPGG